MQKLGQTIVNYHDISETIIHIARFAASDFCAGVGVRDWRITWRIAAVACLRSSGIGERGGAPTENCGNYKKTTSFHEKQFGGAFLHVAQDCNNTRSISD